ncbi:PREDICTED: heme transporter hrg1-A-like isoform X1 [Acromyrmex echinatior]|uniref:Heme transporter hrg1-A n=1 Tax=Acromyrmex echinatior TaxID=103372 RepID=F4X4Y5_ACREC|nr:PREDICTED: heme transporter hrg1-A-like isoform X1 [Acromyrmex echinatior]EGI58558.1 hypothetical protein G5I_13408 [Acromyrmex echinatior]
MLRVLVRLLISAIGIVMAVFAFFILFIIYGNRDVGFWSILTGALAGVCFHLHWVKGKETLERWHTGVTLRNLNILGFVSAVISITALIWYLFLTFYYQIPIHPISESTIITAVWSMICGKWGITLMYYSNKYELLVQEGASPILTDNA